MERTTKKLIRLQMHRLICIFVVRIYGGGQHFLMMRLMFLDNKINDKIDDGTEHYLKAQIMVIMHKHGCFLSSIY